MKAPETVAIRNAADIVTARQKGRDLAQQLGFTITEATFVATAISELARNMLLYANGGEIRLAEANHSGQRGITVVAQDTGPGIQDLRRALTGGFSTSGGLGLGLSGVRRLMSAMEVNTRVGEGTTVVATMWLP